MATVDKTVDRTKTPQQRDSQRIELTIIAALKSELKHQQINHDEVAEVLGITYSQVSRLLNFSSHTRNSPSLLQILSVAAMVGYTLNLSRSNGRKIRFNENYTANCSSRGEMAEEISVMKLMVSELKVALNRERMLSDDLRKIVSDLREGIKGVGKK